MSEVGENRPKRRKTGGRQKGTPNRLTHKVRQAMAELAHDNVSLVQAWLQRTAERDPAEAVRLWMHIVEFTLPKLRASVMVSERTPKPVQQMSMLELQAAITAPAIQSR